MKARGDLLFAAGIGIGTAAGFVLGSMVAFRLGSGAPGTVRRIVDRFFHHEQGPKFEYLLQ